jgi:hypothetical protein
VCQTGKYLILPIDYNKLDQNRVTISMVCGGLNGIKDGQYLTSELLKSNNINKLWEVVDF